MSTPARSAIHRNTEPDVVHHPVLQFLSLLLAALGLAPGAAHLLEMPVKLGYMPEQYFTVTSTLYGLFGSVGAVIQFGALAVAGLLAFRSRVSSATRLPVAAAVLFGLSLVAWGALVAPVNAQWSEAIESGSRSLSQVYAELRLRWEYGHVVAFVLWFSGYLCLSWLAVRRPRAESSNTRVDAFA
jgi:hypothetical protein